MVCGLNVAEPMLAKVAMPWWGLLLFYLGKPPKQFRFVSWVNMGKPTLAKDGMPGWDLRLLYLG